VGRPQRHFFVCLNDRSCKPRDAETVATTLELALAQNPELWRDVAVTRTGCLGVCDGPTVVVYPEGVWYAKVSPADAAEIAREHLIAGRIVARLVYHWPED
jgi:(2Fe-2S) ferredoxin